MRRPYTFLCVFSLLSLFFVLILPGFGQGGSVIDELQDGKREYRLVEIPKEIGREADTISSLEVSTRFRRFAAGAPSIDPNASGKAFFFAKRTQKSEVPYAFLEITPPEESFPARTLIDDVPTQIQAFAASGAFSSFGTQVALSRNGLTIAVSAPLDGPNNEGVVFVYDFQSLNVPNDGGIIDVDPTDFLVDAYVGPLFTSADPSFSVPNYQGSIVNFGRQIQFNRNGRSLSISSTLDPSEPGVDIEKGVVYFVRPRENINQGGIENNLSKDPNLEYTERDAWGQGLGMSDGKDVLIGIPLFDNLEDLSEDLNPGGGGIALLYEFAEPLNFEEARKFRAPPADNVENNQFGTSIEINGVGNESLISEPSPSNPAEADVFYFLNNAPPGDGGAENPELFIPAKAELLNPRTTAPNTEFGESLTLSKLGNLGLVGDPGLTRGTTSGVAYFYDLRDPSIDPGNPDVLPLRPRERISPAEILAIELNPTEEDGFDVDTIEIYYQVKGSPKLGNDLRQFARLSLAMENAIRFADETDANFNANFVAISAETDIILANDTEVGDGNGTAWNNNRDSEAGDNGIIESHLILILDADAYLPVELMFFTAVPDEKGVVLRWETASETNNSGFTVQRSHNAEDWENLGWLDGHGTTTSPKSYRFLDESPYNGVNYYRLEQRDFDGTTTFSDIVSARIEVALDGLNVFPNPTRDVVNVVTPENMPVSISLYNMQGQLLFRQVFQDGMKQLPLQRLSSGTYLLEIRNGKEVIHTQQIVKQ